MQNAKWEEIKVKIKNDVAEIEIVFPTLRSQLYALSSLLYLPN
jgi:hypothetical protein